MGQGRAGQEYSGELDFFLEVMIYWGVENQYAKDHIRHM